MSACISLWKQGSVHARDTLAFPSFVLAAAERERERDRALNNLSRPSLRQREEPRLRYCDKYLFHLEPRGWSKTYERRPLAWQTDCSRAFLSLQHISLGYCALSFPFCISAAAPNPALDCHAALILARQSRGIVNVRFPEMESYEDNTEVRKLLRHVRGGDKMSTLSHFRTEISQAKANGIPNWNFLISFFFFFFAHRMIFPV